MGIILAIGIFTTVYTTFGGMKAVMYTDALQAIVLVLGLCAIAWRIMATTNTTLWDLYTYASAQGRGFEVLVSPAFWQLDLHTRFNGWLLLIVLITAPMITLSSDQLVIQRLLTSKNYREARRATYTNYWLNIPLGLPSFLIGWGLLHFYNRFPQKVPVGLSPDNLMAFFIGTELPAPLPGLLVAALLAATMSTTSSVANSLATVVFHDFFLRLGWIKPGSKKEPQLCRILSFSAGVLAMAFSCVLLRAGETVTTTIMETAGLWCSLTSIIFAAFLIGVTVPWVSAHAMKWGLAIGGILTLGLPLICYYPVPVAERISFAWLWIPGFLVAITLPLLLSKFWPHQKSVDKLTLWTLGEETTTSPAKSS
jgi:Na+/proline symporter